MAYISKRTRTKYARLFENYIHLRKGIAYINNKYIHTLAYIFLSNRKNRITIEKHDFIKTNRQILTRSNIY